jgi:hypothetical protein
MGAQAGSTPASLSSRFTSSMPRTCLAWKPNDRAASEFTATSSKYRIRSRLKGQAVRDGSEDCLVRFYESSSNERNRKSNVSSIGHSAVWCSQCILLVFLKHPICRNRLTSAKTSTVPG